MFFSQGELIFLFIISISLHNLRTVSGFFLLNNDDSFNAFGLLKKYFGIIFFLSLAKEIINQRSFSLCWIDKANK